MFLKSFSTLSRPLPTELMKHIRCNYRSNQHLPLKFTKLASPIERQTIFQLKRPRTLTWLEIFLRITNHTQDWRISWWKVLIMDRLIAFNLVDKTKIVTKRWFWPLVIAFMWETQSNTDRRSKGIKNLLQLITAFIWAYCKGKTRLDWTGPVKYWLDF